MIFDGCVFDETVFDAEPCVVPVTPGHWQRSGRNRTVRFPDLVEAPEVADEDAEFVLLH